VEVLTSTTLDRARQIVQHAHAISPSASLLRLEQQLRQGGSNARQLAKLIDGSPALAARVLRMANSAFYAPAEPVSGGQGAELRRAQLDPIAGGVSRELVAARRKHSGPLVEDPSSHDLGVDRVRALGDPLLGVGHLVGTDIGSGIRGFEGLVHLPAARRELDAGRQLTDWGCPVLGSRLFRTHRGRISSRRLLERRR
jgi:hypothetical protein